MTPILPPELIGLIIDHVAQYQSESERKSALTSTALVCQSFRSWAHKYLFVTIILCPGFHGPPSAMEVNDRLYALR